MILNEIKEETKEMTYKLLHGLIPKHMTHVDVKARCNISQGFDLAQTGYITVQIKIEELEKLYGKGKKD